MHLIIYSLSSDVSCRPVSVVLALPWPNVTDVRQMCDGRRMRDGCLVDVGLISAVVCMLDPCCVKSLYD